MIRVTIENVPERDSPETLAVMDITMHQKGSDVSFYTAVIRHIQGNWRSQHSFKHRHRESVITLLKRALESRST